MGKGQTGSCRLTGRQCAVYYRPDGNNCFPVHDKSQGNFPVTCAVVQHDMLPTTTTHSVWQIPWELKEHLNFVANYTASLKYIQKELSTPTQQSEYHICRYIHAILTCPGCAVSSPSGNYWNVAVRKEQICKMVANFIIFRNFDLRC